MDGPYANGKPEACLVDVKGALDCSLDLLHLTDETFWECRFRRRRIIESLLSGIVASLVKHTGLKHKPYRLRKSVLSPGDGVTLYSCIAWGSFRDSTAPLDPN
jgi:hypothetical protein